MACSSRSVTAFLWFQNLAAVSSLFTWLAIMISYIGFFYATRAQGIDRHSMVYKSPFQPYLAYGATAFFCVIILFNGFDSIAGGFKYQAFITDYVGVVIFFGLYLFWRLLKRTHFIKAENADIYTGKAALDAMVWPQRVAKNWVERVWFWVA